MALLLNSGAILHAIFVSSNACCSMLVAMVLWSILAEERVVVVVVVAVAVAAVVEVSFFFFCFLVFAGSDWVEGFSALWVGGVVLQWVLQA